MSRTRVQDKGADAAVALARLRADMVSGRARKVREGARLSQAEAAEAVGVRQSRLADWESGRRSPRGDAAMAYAALLERLEEIGRRESA
jgi:transcriptional regulator with XRE-family HTH domain